MLPVARVQYVHPDLGYSWPDKGVAWISRDLKDSALLFIWLHEIYHLDDTTFYSHCKFKREFEAYRYAWKREPYGALKCAWMVLSSWDRFVGLFEKKEIEWKEG